MIQGSHFTGEDWCQKPCKCINSHLCMLKLLMNVAWSDFRSVLSYVYFQQSRYPPSVNIAQCKRWNKDKREQTCSKGTCRLSDNLIKQLLIASNSYQLHQTVINYKILFVMTIFWNICLLSAQQSGGWGLICICLFEWLTILLPFFNINWRDVQRQRL